jgi:hypothetical protein
MVPRLSAYYEMSALFFFERGQDVQCWFQLMAAWAYEDEDEKENYRAFQGQQITLDLDQPAAV